MLVINAGNRVIFMATRAKNAVNLERYSRNGVSFNTNGRHFGKNEIHVHDFYVDKKGHIQRSRTARPASKKERRILMMARYGGLK